MEPAKRQKQFCCFYIRLIFCFDLTYYSHCYLLLNLAIGLNVLKIATCIQMLSSSVYWMIYFSYHRFIF